MIRRSALAGLLLLLPGCGAGAATQPLAAPTPEPAPGAASAAAGDVQLQVTGFHLYPLAPDAPGAAAAAAALDAGGAPLAQLHLLLTVRNSGTGERSVAADDVQLALGERELAPSTAAVFPPAPLRPGEAVDTAVGFDVALRATAGLALRWTHDGTVRVVPLEGTPQAG